MGTPNNTKTKVHNSRKVNHHHHLLTKEQIKIIKQIAQEQSRDAIREWCSKRAAHTLL